MTFGELRDLQDKKERNSSRKVDNNLQDKKQRKSLRKEDNNVDNRKAFKAMHVQTTEAMKVEAHPATAASQQPVYNAEHRELCMAIIDEITAERVKAKAQLRLEYEELFGVDSEEETQHAADMQVLVPPATASAQQATSGDPQS